eukprot:3264044-Prymnesium_polylepis.1
MWACPKSAFSVSTAQYLHLARAGAAATGTSVGLVDNERPETVVRLGGGRQAHITSSRFMTQVRQTMRRARRSAAQMVFGTIAARNATALTACTNVTYKTFAERRSIPLASPSRASSFRACGPSGAADTARLV